MGGAGAAAGTCGGSSGRSGRSTSGAPVGWAARGARLIKGWQADTVASARFEFSALPGQRRRASKAPLPGAPGAALTSGWNVTAPARPAAGRPPSALAGGTGGQGNGAPARRAPCRAVNGRLRARASPDRCRRRLCIPSTRRVSVARPISCRDRAPIVHPRAPSTFAPRSSRRPSAVRRRRRVGRGGPTTSSAGASPPSTAGGRGEIPRPARTRGTATGRRARRGPGHGLRRGRRPRAERRPSARSVRDRATCVLAPGAGGRRADRTPARQSKAFYVELRGRGCVRTGGA